MTRKEYGLLLLILALTFALPLISQWASAQNLFPEISPLVNKHVIYQTITLALTVVFLAVLRLAKKKTFLLHFRKGIISADVIPEPGIGLRPSSRENWLHVGRNFALIITGVTALIIFFQIIKGAEINFQRLPTIIPIALGFSLTNSFVEESITRLGIVVTLKDMLPDRYIMFISGALFGVVHYWGAPGGITGVLFAGFLGWFLAKSILETKGIFWAWFIHFLQDVVIFSAMLITE